MEDFDVTTIDDSDGYETLVEEALMSYKVTKSKLGIFEVAVKVVKFSADAEGEIYPDGTVNTWSLGLNEEIAKSKVKTIIDSYLKGLEFVQSEVRRVFVEEEEKPS